MNSAQEKEKKMIKKNLMKCTAVMLTVCTVAGNVGTLTTSAAEANNQDVAVLEANETTEENETTEVNETTEENEIAEAPAEEEVTEVAEEVDTMAADSRKTPKQLNVHVGDDAATEVNVTYTTQDEVQTTCITYNKVGDVDNKTTVDGTHYQGIGGKYIHEISVKGLEAGTEYEYTVGYGANVKSGTFKTALAKNDKKEFTFAYLADTQVSNGTNAKALGATLAKVNELDPDFVYLAGDTTDKATSEAQWEWLFNNEGTYPTGGEDMFANNLIAVTQGNHDNNELYQHINAPEEAGKIVYSFDYGTMKFISLNLEAARSDENAREEQMAYLKQEVAAAKADGQWVVVGFHKSLYTGASHVDDGDIVAARKYWAPTLAELGVDLVLQGHDHVYSRGFVTTEGQNANAQKDAEGNYVQPSEAPLYMVGGHAGGLKWYSPVKYTVTEGDPLALNYSFLDVNSALADNPSYNSKEQVITLITVSEDKISSKTINFKYDMTTDEITTAPYTYDEFSIVKDTTASISGPESAVVEEEEIEYTVSFDNVESANVFETELEYDKAKLELVRTEGLLENTILNIDKETEAGVKTTVGVQNEIASDASIPVVKYVFKVKEAGVEQNEAVKVTLKNAIATGEDKSVDAFEYKNEVQTNIYSYAKACDVNGDKKVDARDLSKALKNYQTAESSSDINRDGVVDVKDYVIIAQYI